MLPERTARYARMSISNEVSGGVRQHNLLPLATKMAYPFSSSGPPPFPKTACLTSPI